MSSVLRWGLIWVLFVILLVLGWGMFDYWVSISHSGFVHTVVFASLHLGVLALLVAAMYHIYRCK